MLARRIVTTKALLRLDVGQGVQGRAAGWAGFGTLPGCAATVLWLLVRSGSRSFGSCRGFARRGARRVLPSRGKLSILRIAAAYSNSSPKPVMSRNRVESAQVASR